MDVFGLQIIQNPESFLSLNEEYTDQLVEVAQDAFSAEGIPSREDTVNHVLPVSTLVVAYDAKEDEYVGFSSTDRVAGTVYENGMAVGESAKNNGLGKAMLSLSILEEMQQEEETVTFRTQNPVMYNCANEVFDLYPRPDEDVPGELDQSLEQVATALDPDGQYDDHVMKEAYPGPMYSGLPDGEIRDFMENKGMDYREGDSIMVGGQVPEQEIQRAVDEYISQSDAVAGVNHI